MTYPWVSNNAWEPEDKSKRIPRRIFMTCKCGKGYYSQKNIGGIGCRSIFHHAGGCEWMRAQFNPIGCNCPGSDLHINEELMAHVLDCPECTAYGY